MKAVTTLALIGTLLCGALAAQKIRPTSILLKDGGAVTVTLLADDGKTIKVRRFDDGRIVVHTYAELHPRTIYRLMKARTPEGDAVGQMLVASYALDQNLFEAARRHYRLALKADQELGGKIATQLEQLRQRAAVRVLAWSREHLNDGNSARAERYLGILLVKFPDSEVAAEAARLLDENAARAQADREREIRERVQRDYQVASRRALKRLEPGKASYRKAHELKRRGLKSTKSHTKALRAYKAAITELKNARRILDKVSRTIEPDTPLGALLKSYDETLDRDMVQFHLLLAEEYLARGSHSSARRAAREARRIDPRSSEVASMLARIEAAANSSEGYGGLRRGGSSGGRKKGRKK